MPFELTSRAKPVLKWAGGKSSLLSQLLPHFPKKFDRYVEPFLGGGAVLFALRDCMALVSDGNLELIHLYRVLRDEPEKVMKRLDGFSRKYGEDFFYRLRNKPEGDPIYRAARTLFLNKTGYNGLYRQNQGGGFNVPFGKRPACPNLYDRENILHVVRRLRRVSLRHWDFERVLDSAGKGDFVYCDPPYEPLSRSSSFNAYFRGKFSQADQQRLKDACARAARRGATIAISNSSAPFILEQYEGWQIEPIAARRSINCNATGRGSVLEVLIRA